MIEHGLTSAPTQYRLYGRRGEREKSEWEEGEGERGRGGAGGEGEGLHVKGGEEGKGREGKEGDERRGDGRERGGVRGLLAIVLQMTPLYLYGNSGRRRVKTLQYMYILSVAMTRGT